MNVELSDDPRALAAGRAMATWAWAKVYTLSHGLGGFIPRVAVGASWVGRAQGLKDMAALAAPAVALVTEVDGGWELVVDGETSSGARNDGADRSPAAIRAKRYRDNLKKAREESVTDRDGERDASRTVTRDCASDAGSDSSRDASRSLARSPSDLGSESSSSSRPSDHPESLDPLTHPPAWRDEQVKSVELARGRKPVDVEQCWARFVTTSQRDARAITPEAWKAFVVLQLGYDANDARRGRRIVQRDPPGPRAFEVDDGNHDYAAMAAARTAEKGTGT